MLSLHNFTYFIQTYGCQMNCHDSERVAGMLEALGAQNVSDFADADIVVFMTCCVREAADIRLYGQVATIKNLPMRDNSPLKKRIVAVGGCIGQRDGSILSKTQPNVNIVFGTHNIASLPALIESVVNDGKPAIEILSESNAFSSDLPSVREKNWSAWVPITIGCNNFCTYCVVPYVRGREKSRPIESILSEIEDYKAQGVQEITLLGQNVNSYGNDLYGKNQFANLLKEIDKIEIPRVRFATSHPKDLSPEVIELFGSMKTLMPALHLPVQSGSNTILKAMRRVYTIEHYRGLIDQLKSVNPAISLSTDVIVGFPGEREEDFLQTLNIIEEVGYNQVFTFIYSKRAGTPAAKMEDTTPKEVIQERFDRLVASVQNRAFDANQKYKNIETTVLVDGVSKRDSTLITGRSPHNITVHAPLLPRQTLESVLGKIIPVKIDSARTWYLSAHQIED